MLEIIVNFNTTAFVKGTLTKDRLKIARNYLNQNFFFDLITVLALLQTFGHFGTFFFFLKFFSYNNILNMLREKLILQPSLNGSYQLVKLALKMLFMCHIVACLWYYIGKYQLDAHNPEERQKSWLITQNIEQGSKFEQYVLAFYFAIITMGTIGYGDVTPHSNIEKIYVIFVVFVSCGMVGYTVNSIGGILLEINKRKEIYEQRLAELN